MAYFTSSLPLERQMSLPSSKFYTTKEVAAFEGVTEDYLRKQVSKGEFIKPTHVGRPHRWLKAVIDKHYSDMNEQAIKHSA
jgi:predicted DNA-binding transcriptional regulator AlpA